MHIIKLTVLKGKIYIVAYVGMYFKVKCKCYVVKRFL